MVRNRRLTRRTSPTKSHKCMASCGSPATLSTVAATVGGYELVQRLAVGGMSEVFLAKRPGPEGFEKRVAVKRILPHLAKQADFVDMFLDEARLAASLDHPHIVHIHDFGVDGGAYYLAMEFVCGEDVAALFRRARETGAPLPLEDVVTILI